MFIISGGGDPILHVLSTKGHHTWMIPISGGGDPLLSDSGIEKIHAWLTFVCNIQA